METVEVVLKEEIVRKKTGEKFDNFVKMLEKSDLIKEENLDNEPVLSVFAFLQNEIKNEKEISEAKEINEAFQDLKNRFFIETGLIISLKRFDPLYYHSSLDIDYQATHLWCAENAISYTPQTQMLIPFVTTTAFIAVKYPE